jgi:hypothetical protein
MERDAGAPDGPLDKDMDNVFGEAVYGDLALRVRAMDYGEAVYGELALRVRELELILDTLANHSAHMMYNQVNGWKPHPDMANKATALEVRAQMAANRPVVRPSDWEAAGCPRHDDPSYPTGC